MGVMLGSPGAACVRTTPHHPTRPSHSPCVSFTFRKCSLLQCAMWRVTASLLPLSQQVSEKPPLTLSLSPQIGPGRCLQQSRRPCPRRCPEQEGGCMELGCAAGSQHRTELATLAPQP